VSEAGGTSFAQFFEVKDYATGTDAVIAVDNGEAQCVVMNDIAYRRILDAQPQFSLQELCRSEPMPEAVLVGCPQAWQSKLGPHMWNNIQNNLAVIHKTPKGRDCVRFWRFDWFAKPDRNYNNRVLSAVKTYPLDRLTNLQP
jgi:ABC-type phosphate/phosphonate transport system substrate-binding protein